MQIVFILLNVPLLIIGALASLVFNGLRGGWSVGNDIAARLTEPR